MSKTKFAQNTNGHAILPNKQNNNNSKSTTSATTTTTASASTNGHGSKYSSSIILNLDKYKIQQDTNLKTQNGSRGITTSNEQLPQVPKKVSTFMVNEATRKNEFTLEPKAITRTSSNINAPNNAQSTSFTPQQQQQQRKQQQQQPKEFLTAMVSPRDSSLQQQHQLNTDENKLLIAQQKQQQQQQNQVGKSLPSYDDLLKLSTRPPPPSITTTTTTTTTATTSSSTRISLDCPIHGHQNNGQLIKMKTTQMPSLLMTTSSTPTATQQTPNKNLTQNALKSYYKPHQDLLSQQYQQQRIIQNGTSEPHLIYTQMSVTDRLYNGLPTRQIQSPTQTKLIQVNESSQSTNLISPRGVNIQQMSKTPDSLATLNRIPSASSLNVHMSASNLNLVSSQSRQASSLSRFSKSETRTHHVDESTNQNQNMGFIEDNPHNNKNKSHTTAVNSDIEVYRSESYNSTSTLSSSSTCTSTGTPTSTLNNINNNNNNKHLGVKHHLNQLKTQVSSNQMNAHVSASNNDGDSRPPGRLHYYEKDSDTNTISDPNVQTQLNQNQLYLGLNRIKSAHEKISEVLSDSPSLSDMSAKNYVGNGGRTSTPNNNNNNNNHHHHHNAHQNANSSVTNHLKRRRSSPSISAREAAKLRRQIVDLEKMYQDILKLIESDTRNGRMLGGGGGGGIDSWQTKSSTGMHTSTTVSSFTSSIKNDQANLHNKSTLGNNSSKQITKSELKQANQRFNRLENHVINLAKTVAHISTEVQSIKSIEEELYSLRRDVHELKASSSGQPHEQMITSLQPCETNFLPPLTKNINTRTHGYTTSGKCWMSQFSNPKRLKKLTKFFGEEPPMLRLFLKKLGYETYASVFEYEKINITELPYCSEDRLKTLGIPLGPRLRIIQEAQLAFRQDNLNIYIV